LPLTSDTSTVPGGVKESPEPTEPMNSDDRLTPAPRWTGKNPCPKLHSFYRRTSKGKRGLGHKHEQLDFNPIDASEGMCCMDPDGPADNLIAMSFPGQVGKGGVGSGIAGIVAGVAGGILLAGGMALAVLRKRREEHRFKALDDYAVPN